MPLINYLKLYGADVARVLAPGERLIELGPYREPLAGDESRLERTADELDPLTRRLAARGGPRKPPSDRFIQGIDPLSGVQVNENRIDRFFGGITGEGGVESFAGRLWRSAKANTKIKYYAVTDRRLLLLVEQGKINSGDYRIAFEAPRSAVLSARRRGKLLFQWGRVELRFSDGSMKACTLGMLSVGRANALVAALSGDGAPG